MNAAQRTARTIATECVGARVRLMNRAVSRLYDELLRPHGIRFSQMNILTIVTLKGPVRPVDVARILSLEKSTLSRNVRLMEDQGWIESLPGETGKELLLQVTPAGGKLLRKATPAWQEAQDRLTGILGQPAANELRKAADLLRSTL